MNPHGQLIAILMAYNRVSACHCRLSSGDRPVRRLCEAWNFELMAGDAGVTLASLLISIGSLVESVESVEPFTIPPGVEKPQLIMKTMEMNAAITSKLSTPALTRVSLS